MLTYEDFLAETGQGGEGEDIGRAARGLARHTLHESAEDDADYVRAAQRWVDSVLYRHVSMLPEGSSVRLDVWTQGDGVIIRGTNVVMTLDMKASARSDWSSRRMVRGTAGRAAIAGGPPVMNAGRHSAVLARGHRMLWMALLLVGLLWGITTGVAFARDVIVSPAVALVGVFAVVTLGATLYRLGSTTGEGSR